MITKKQFSLRGFIFRSSLGLFCLFIASKLKEVDSQSTQIIASVCAENESSAWCTLIKFGLQTVGLSGVWVSLLIVGVFLIILYDLLSFSLGKLLDDVIENLMNVAQTARDQLCNNRLHKDEIKKLIVDCFGSFDSVQEKEGRDFGGFINKIIIDEREGAIWRKDLRCDIAIETLPSSVKLNPKDFFIWRETTTYVVCCHKENTNHTITASARLAVPEFSVDSLIENFNYNVQFGDTQLASFDQIKSVVKLEKVKSDQGFKEGCFHVIYKSGSLFIKYQQEVTLEVGETSIATDERSVLEAHDKEYVLALLAPTKGLTLRFQVPHGYHVHSCLAGQNSYSRRAAEVVPAVVRCNGRSAEITAPSWALPGIGGVIVWRHDS